MTSIGCDRYLLEIVSNSYMTSKNKDFWNYKFTCMNGLNTVLNRSVFLSEYT